jgi:diguanylate cyclase (GGDEF)-like protein
LNRLKDVENINNELLDNLYAFTRQIVFILAGVSVILLYLLYSSLSNLILYWCIPFWMILFIRLYSAYLYKYNRDKFTLNQWYTLYLFFAFFIAMYLSSMSILFFSQLTLEFQLYIILILIGVSFGAASAFPSNYRLGLVYLIIIILPLCVELLMADKEIYYVLLLLLLLNVLGQVGLIIRNYKHEEEFSQLLSEHKILNNLFKEAPNGIFIYDNNLKILECNEKFLSLFGNNEEGMIAFDLNTLNDKHMVTTLKDAISHGVQTYSGEYISMTNKQYWVDIQIFPYKNKYDKTIGNIALVSDNSKEHRALNELNYLVEHDALTGLLNRRGFYSTMENLIKNKLHETHYSLLFYLDLNQFKGINDSLGHSTGDAVLLHVAQRLNETIGIECDVCRLGGDEFIIIYPYISENLTNAKMESEQYSESINSIFTKAFIIEDLHLHISTSMGVIILEPNYMNIEEVVRHADITMYQAKNSNENVAYYNELLDVAQKELFNLQHDLAYAEGLEEFEMYFQPIVHMHNDSLCAAEALIRWNHPKKGMLSPDAFIPLSIKAGLLSQITWWVLDNVCSQIVKWKKLNCWNLEYISINVNAQQLIENNFAVEFLYRLNKYGINTEDIVIEITERSLIDNFDNTQGVINELRSHGIRCAIDDFGIGYSSLSYLKKLSFHTLKIDREFVKDIEFNPEEITLVSTILDIGRQFNYNIVIEGIEDKKQKDLLLGLDSNLRYQGYYCSKPIDAEEFRKTFLIKQ